MIKNLNAIFKFIEPPGCLSNSVGHPSGMGKSIELALIQEHRFAFYYWLKWTNALEEQVIPSLITFDWHQDLCKPYTDQLEELQALNAYNSTEVALYTWGKLSHENDVQIIAALLHNKIKDVYAICRQEVNRDSHFVVTDFFGNDHSVYIFKDLSDLRNQLPKIKDKAVYWDIDLDYFTLSNPLSRNSPYKKRSYSFLKKKEIVAMLQPDDEIIQWIFERLKGFTIATEPRFCGGLKYSNKFLNIIDELYFTPSLFHFVPSPNTKMTQWKHLS